MNGQSNPLDSNISHTVSKPEKLNLGLLTILLSTGRLHPFIYLAFLGFVGVLSYYVSTRYQHLIPLLLQYLLPALISFFLAVALTPLSMQLARRFGVVNKNSTDHAQKVATPLLGGLAIYLSATVTLLFYRPLNIQTLSILLGGSLVFILGTIDDIKPLSSLIRLIGQFTAASLVIKSGLVLTFLPNTGWGEGLAFILTVIWILGIINATNFVDGADGLAAGFAMITSIFFFLITLHLQQYSVVLISAVIAGSTLGFLIFNFKPAKIFLGDGGSTYLGFILACLALYGEWSSWGPIISLGIPTLILGVLIFDVIYITISRIKNGQVRTFKEWLDYRGRDHFHHRLMNLGFREEEAVVFIYATCIILGLSALVIEHARVSYPVVVLLIQATLILVIITMLMLKGRQLTDDRHGQ